MDERVKYVFCRKLGLADRVVEGIEQAGLKCSVYDQVSCTVLMVLIIYGGNSEIGAHVWIDLDHFICLRNLLDRKQSKFEILFRKVVFSSIGR